MGTAAHAGQNVRENTLLCVVRENTLLCVVRENTLLIKTKGV